MIAGLDREQTEALLARVADVLERRLPRGQTLTYLELADAIAMPAPHRIHRTTCLLEILLQRDAAAGEPIRAALVVSRVGGGLPAHGFFDCAKQVGLFGGDDAAAFHQALLQELRQSRTQHQQVAE